MALMVLEGLDLSVADLKNAGAEHYDIEVLQDAQTENDNHNDRQWLIRLVARYYERRSLKIDVPAKMPKTSQKIALTITSHPDMM